MLKLRSVLFFFVLMCLPAFSMAQDAFFSQFYANRLYLNPAWAGVGNEKRIFLNYRNQYPGIGSIYNTYTLSFDQFTDGLHGGVGFSLSNDVQGGGAMNQINISTMYSYHLKAGRFLSFAGGLQASVISRMVNASGFEFGDQYDPVTGTVNSGSGSESYANTAMVFPDFSTGIAAFYKNSYGGISMFHLLKPYQSESSFPGSRLPRKFTLFAGTWIPVYEKRLGKEVLQLNPNIIFIQQKNHTQLIYGLEGLYKETYIAGVWLRQNLGLKFSAVIFSGGVSLNNIRLRYSYDAHVSLPSVQIPGMGAHEISMIIAFDGDKKNKHKAIKCPKI